MSKPHLAIQNQAVKYAQKDMNGDDINIKELEGKIPTPKAPKYLYTLYIDVNSYFNTPFGEQDVTKELSISRTIISSNPDLTVNDLKHMSFIGETFVSRRINCDTTVAGESVSLQGYVVDYLFVGTSDTLRVFYIPDYLDIEVQGTIDTVDNECLIDTKNVKETQSYFIAAEAPEDTSGLDNYELAYTLSFQKTEI